jgi:hypothetical protein
VKTTEGFFVRSRRPKNATLSLMGRTVQDIEAYLMSMGRAFEQAEDGLIMISPTQHQSPPIGVMVGEPVVFSVDIGPAPTDNVERSTDLFRRLLELNATDLLFCAYGVRGTRIVLSAALALENLDANEVRSVIDDIDLALDRHIPELFALANRGSAPETSNEK